ncbi:type IV pilus assembly protein PilQ [Winogradskyella wandonensis]|uniref:Type IV pilus assembly protein PilQ n=1 Tax=Winogradskyella wandonensis TaxID=1442586 RepID=A0A4R1KU52_9FLAO|nr:general secretion pathway protein GspD [Winogradskyella wandonensis]TCK68070.1 type IV pilus assembly protein PilQ [Winogradskyella wandonensis]
MKKLLLTILLAVSLFGFTQESQTDRIAKLKTQLEILSTEVNGLTEIFKTEIKANNLTISNLLLAVADVHKLNINPSQELNSITISPSFPEVIVSDLLIFLCKEYDLTMDFTGTIISVKRYIAVPDEPEIRVIPVVYNPINNTISIDAKGDKLYDVFKRITDESGKNLVFAPGLKDKSITAYIQKTPFKMAMDNLAFANDLFVDKSKEGFYYFESNETNSVANTQNETNLSQTRQRPVRRRNSNFFFEIKNQESQLLDVDFVNTPIADIINDIGNELNIDVFTATPLEEAGSITFKAKNIYFDDLLTKLFEIQGVTANTQNTSQNTNNSNRPSVSNTKRFTFKKENNIYFFGLEGQLSVREVAVITLQNRSVELLSDPSGGQNRRSVGRSFNSGFGNSRGFNNQNFNQNLGFNNTNQNRNQLNTNTTGNFNSYSNQVEALVNILPDEVKQDLDIKVDYELNSFYVNGPSTNVDRFRTFIEKIDKPVPVILIEVMILEINRSSTLEAGVSWGIGDEPSKTQGAIFPEADLTLGANTVNRIIGGLDGFGGFNFGRVVPNFFARIKAMESNGDLKIRSTPRISTLNGHRATFSNGQTSYYTITDQSIIGSDNPVTQTAINFVPIDAELGLTIKPTVSGNGQVTLDIFVVQSSFGNRISDQAPPDINSREFSSLIRMKDQDIAVLGGLEEQSTSNSGSGVPFLARVPIIKWLFSKRVREGRKAKLTVLIKPTVIY